MSLKIEGRRRRVAGGIAIGGAEQEAYRLALFQLQAVEIHILQRIAGEEVERRVVAKHLVGQQCRPAQVAQRGPGLLPRLQEHGLPGFQTQAPAAEKPAEGNKSTDEKAEKPAAPATDAPALAARQIFVKTGRHFGGLVEIKEGVKAGDEVITAGQNRLSNGAPVKVDNTLTPALSKANPGAAQ